MRSRTHTPVEYRETILQGRWGKFCVVFLFLCVIVVAQGVLGDGVFAGYQTAVQPLSQQKSVMWLNTPESLGEVQDMLLQIGLEDYFTVLRTNGFTNLNAIGGSQLPPPRGMKPYHWKLIRREAYLLLQPEGSPERELAIDPSEDYPDATNEQLSMTICQSWANTEGMHIFMRSLKGQKGSAIPNTTVPACAGSMKKEPRGVLYSTLSVDAHIATVVGMDGGWFRNDLSLNQVGSMRKRGIIQQLVFDHDLKIMYCGIPKAGYTINKSWMLKAANAWNTDLKSNDSSGELNGPRIESGRYMKDTQIQTALNAGGYFKFTYVRDPFTRVLATFHDRIYDCHKRRSPAECRTWVRLLMGVNARRQKLEGVNFRQYVLMLEKLKQRKGTVDITYQTAHYLPQTTVCGMDQMVYDFVGKIENEDEDSQVVYDIVGNQGLTNRQRRSFDASANVAEQVYHYGVDTETIAGNIRTIKSIYEADRLLLGYVGESLFAYLTSVE